MSGYTKHETQGLLPGAVGGRERGAVRSKDRDSIDILGGRGLVRIGHEVLANGNVNSFPLCLRLAGVLEVRTLEGGHPGVGSS